jgi:nitroreductase
MDLEKVFEKRRSIRKFLSVHVEWEKLCKIVSAGACAPCAGNIQNWKFVIITDHDTKEKVAESALEQYWIGTAPAIIVVCAETSNIKKFYGLRGEKLYSIQNCSAAIQNMLLQVINLNLGTCWVSAFDENMLSRTLGIPDDVRPQAILPIGYPDEKPPKPMKLDLADFTYKEGYGNKIDSMDDYLKNRYYLEKAIDKSKGFISKLKKK